MWDEEPPDDSAANHELLEEIRDILAEALEVAKEIRDVFLAEDEEEAD